MEPNALSGETKCALGIEEFAKTLGISRSLVYELIRAGKVKSVKIGRLRRIPATEVQRVLGQ